MKDQTKGVRRQVARFLVGSFLLASLNVRSISAVDTTSSSSTSSNNVRGSIERTTEERKLQTKPPLVQGEGTRVKDPNSAWGDTADVDAIAGWGTTPAPAPDDDTAEIPGWGTTPQPQTTKPTPSLTPAQAPTPAPEEATLPPVPVLDIVAGTAITPGEFPYFAVFPDNNCGGTLLSPSRVLTSASCVTELGLPAFVRVGATNFTDGVVAPVSCYKVHPSFQRVTETDRMGQVVEGFYYDLAILKLTNPVTGIPGVIGINGNTQYFETPGTPVTAVGFGFIGPNGPPATVVQKADLSVMDIDDCRNMLPGFELIVDGLHLCAAQAPAGVCNGDGGGPLIDQATGILVGITSFRYGACGSSDSANVFTDISDTTRWIFGQLETGDDAVQCDVGVPIPPPTPAPTPIPITLPPVTTKPKPTSPPTRAPVDPDADKWSLTNVLYAVVGGGFHLLDRIVIGIQTGDWLPDDDKFQADDDDRYR